MPLSGDLSKFPLLRAALKELAGLPSRLAAPVAARINKRLRAQFDNATDPYGRPHPRNAPLTIAKKGFDHPMTETGESANETRAIPLQGTGVGIVANEKVALNMVPGPSRPARPMLPLSGLPSTWRSDISDEADKLARRAKGRVR